MQNYNRDYRHVVNNSSSTIDKFIEIGSKAIRNTINVIIKEIFMYNIPKIDLEDNS